MSDPKQVPLWVRFELLTKSLATLADNEVRLAGGDPAHERAAPTKHDILGQVEDLVVQLEALQTE